MKPYSYFKSLLALLILVGVNQSALALTPSASPDLVINLSGSSSQQKTLGNILAGVCAGDLHSYLDQPATGSNGNKFRSYFCTLKSADADVPNAIEGERLLVNTRAAGGSVWGTIPVAREWAVEYLNIFNGNCSQTSGDGSSGEYACTWEGNRSNGAGECPQTAYVPGGSNYVGSISSHSGTASNSTVCLRSDGGLSDVESASLPDGGLTGGPLSAAEVSSLTSSRQFGVIFGVALTENAYRSLQNIQFPGTYADIADTAGEPTDTTDALRPNLPRSAIRSLLTSGSSIDSLQALDQAIVAPAGTSGFLALCRRAPGSGAQRAQDIFLMGNCLGSARLNMRDSTDGGTFVFQNSTTGDVRDCLNGAVDGTLLGGQLDAIGFLSLENQPGAGDAWQFIKIDGVDPTVDNAIAGTYPNWFEQAIVWKTSAVTGNTLAALQMVRDAAGNPVLLEANGAVGVAVLQGAVNNSNDWETDPLTMRGTRGGNSCGPLQLDADS